MSELKAWVRENRRNPDVRSWAASNPPPDDWEGTELEWAYTAMPNPEKVRTLLWASAFVGAAALGWWLWRRRTAPLPTLVPGASSGPALQRVARCRADEYMSYVPDPHCVPLPQCGPDERLFTPIGGAPRCMPRS